MKGTTIPHEVLGEFGAGQVMLKPAAPGTGVIAGGPVRASFGSCRDTGYSGQNPLGSSNAHNMVHATVQGLQSLKRAEEVARLRGKTLEEFIWVI